MKSTTIDAYTTDSQPEAANTDTSARTADTTRIAIPLPGGTIMKKAVAPSYDCPRDDLQGFAWQEEMRHRRVRSVAQFFFLMGSLSLCLAMAAHWWIGF
ncbi:hypothetical protein [Cellvibrio japonicus]|uniref:hypothetical protein n=1 Tax=Cellvibrio japonicus TaxID=155077 RepID=UPI00030BFACB|nr:hypothetical protein [Cellvibrio japonicus]QEI11592.1 hypothetical protein FY117_04685 [Cellvibrio japonicus]QEI15166.1 hypothetical protein FY116_04685 [Cellvibrio japonicus]QEI18746.1 hypothetical protein FY115_04685 [Cellvibrio japonicus]